jgi:hypothetical protein
LALDLNSGLSQLSVLQIMPVQKYRGRYTPPAVDLMWLSGCLRPGFKFSCKFSFLLSVDFKNSRQISILYRSNEEVQIYAARWLWYYNNWQANIDLERMTPEQELATVVRCLFLNLSANIGG